MFWVAYETHFKQNQPDSTKNEALFVLAVGLLVYIVIFVSTAMFPSPVETILKTSKRKLQDISGPVLSSATAASYSSGSYEMTLRMQQIQKLDLELPPQEEVLRLKSPELLAIHEKIHSAIKIAKLNCTHYTTELQSYYSLQQHFEAQALKLQSFISWLKTNQDREVRGILERLQSQIQQFEESFRTAQQGKFKVQQQDAIAELNVVGVTNTATLATSAHFDPFAFLPVVPDLNNSFFNLFNNDGSALDPPLLPDIGSFNPLPIQFDKLPLPPLEEESHQNQPQQQQPQTPSLPPMAELPIDFSDLVDDDEDKTDDALVVISTPKTDSFVPPITQEKNITSFALKVGFAPMFPLKLPLRLQALTKDQNHLMEVLILRQDTISGNYITKLVFAGKYREPVVFSSLEEAWWVCSHLCKEGTIKTLKPMDENAKVDAWNAFRFMEPYDKTQHSFRVLMQDFYPTLQELVRKQKFRDLKELPPCLDATTVSMEAVNTSVWPTAWIK